MQTVIDLGLSDPDLRVRSAAMNLQSHVAPQQTLALALAAYESDAPTDVISRPDWAATIARHDAVFEAYVADKLPGGPQLLFGVASQRASPALAAALIRAIPQVEAAQTGQFLSAVLKQHDPAVSRAVFTAREKLPPNLATYATLILEHTFGARLGDVAADWEAWLKQNAK